MNRKQSKREFDLNKLEFDEKGDVISLGGTYNPLYTITVSDGITAQQLIDDCDIEV